MRGGLLLPGDMAKRLSAIDTPAERLQGLVWQGFVNPLHPGFRLVHGPGAQQSWSCGLPSFPLPEASPPPVFGLEDQPGTHRVTFDVPTDGEEMLISLDREGLEAALVQVPSPCRMVVCMPALRVGERDPPDIG